MLFNPVSASVRVWIEVTFLIREIPREQVSHALIHVQIAEGSRPAQAFAVAPCASNGREGVLSAVDDGGGRRRQTHMFSRRVGSHSRATLELSSEPSIRCDVERRRPEQKRLGSGFAARTADRCRCSYQVPTGRHAVSCHALGKSEISSMMAYPCKGGTDIVQSVDGGNVALREAILHRNSDEAPVGEPAGGGEGPFRCTCTPAAAGK